MYNPETITRDYVSYLDQTALDPFNTIYQSANLVAPPSILDFSFSLFFDRGEEATAPDHPGVFVDYQFFDLVVRNVVPDDPNSTSNTLPDNGVMMVNPREITVVFSEQISVQGRPLNARVSFLKFTHRMVPTRMQIDLTIRATYLGPLKPQTAYVAEQFTVADTIPLGEGIAQYQFTYSETEELIVNSDAADPTATIDYAVGNIQAGSKAAREAALDYAKSHTVEGVTQYDADKRMNNMIDNHWSYVDCSSLVSRSYEAVGAAKGMGWVEGTDTKDMMKQVEANPTTFRGRIKSWQDSLYADMHGDEANKPLRGDILLRKGHVAFFQEISGNNLVVFEAASKGSNPQVGTIKYGKTGNDASKWQYVLRPEPTGLPTQVGNTPLTGPK